MNKFCTLEGLIILLLCGLLLVIGFGVLGLITVLAAPFGIIGWTYGTFAWIIIGLSSVSLAKSAWAARFS